MKTAMQELIEVLETQKRLFIEAERHTLADGIGRTILLSKQFIEKEKEQITSAVRYGQNNHEASVYEEGELYYNEIYNSDAPFIKSSIPNGTIEVDAIKSQVTTTDVWTPKTNNL